MRLFQITGMRSGLIRHSARLISIRPDSQLSADTVEKLEKSESQYFWQILFLVINGNHLLHKYTYKSHRETERDSESLPTSFRLKLLYDVNIFRTTTKTEFFNSIGHQQPVTSFQ